MSANKARRCVVGLASSGVNGELYNATRCLVTTCCAQSVLRCVEMENATELLQGDVDVPTFLMPGCPLCCNLVEMYVRALLQALRQDFVELTVHSRVLSSTVVIQVYSKLCGSQPSYVCTQLRIA